MRRVESAHDVQVGPIQFGLQDILAIQWKVMTDLSAADRSQRQALDVLVLRHVLTDTIDRPIRAHPRIANCQGADFYGGRYVTFLQSRRQSERVRDVIEAVCRI